MKITSIIRLLFVFVLAAGFLGAQTTAPRYSITGDLNIRFATRTQTESDGKPKKDAVDTYALSVNVANSARFRGSITHRPVLFGLLNNVSQTGALTYAVDLDVVNPNNPEQTRNVGKLFGSVPIDATNAYRFGDGTLKVGVFGIGAAKGFESKFGGVALGKPPAQSEGMFAKMKKEAMRVVNSKGAAIVVIKYDKMEFQGHIIGAGPVQIYPEVTVNGVMLYDYSRTAWYFQNVKVSYVVDNRRMEDNLTGNIRWVESPARKSNGEGEYQFDIRVNEPPPSEKDAFATATDESAFFAADDLNPALVGSIKYKDAMNTAGIVTSSSVQIALHGNKLNKQQVMYLAKLLFLSGVVPLNAE